MFTGIIEGFGVIRAVRSTGQGKHITIDTGFPLNETRIGDSIAVDGACLTVVSREEQRFETDVSPETLALSTLGKVAVGRRVNLERALQLSARIDGHLVSGHIDGMGVIEQKKNLGNAVIVSIRVPESISRYTIRKGSVAVDGISLTINSSDPGGFEVSIIPHTARMTSIGFKKTGDPVNIETDMIGKYVERFVGMRYENNKPESTTKDSAGYLELLAKNGFL